MNQIIATTGSLILGILVVCLIKKTIREKISDWLIEKQRRIFLLPIAFISYYALSALLVGNFDIEAIGRLSLYFGLPTLLIYLAGPLKDQKRFLILDFILVLLLWLPVELGFVQKSLSVDSMKYPHVAFSAIIYALIVFSGWRKLELNCDLIFRKKDLFWILSVFIALFILILPLAWHCGFIHFFGINPDLAGYYWAIPLMLLVMCFAPGFVEELMFRGLIQNLLGTKLRPMMMLFIASLIFGFAHLNNSVESFRPPNYHYMFFATIAGLGYGLVYWRTKSLIAAAILHALVDTTWLVLFKG